MMMKRLIITMLCVIFALSNHAKSMSEIWADLPCSVIPYLDQAHRMQMMQYVRMGLQGDVDHSLAGKSVMDTLTTDYIHVTLNESVVMELKRLSQSGADSLLCVVTTWKGPAEESAVRFFSQDWQALDLSNAFDGKEIADLADEMMQKPDTMDDKRFAELRSMIDPVMIGVRLSPANDQMQVRLAMPLLCTDDKKAVDAITHEMVLSWNGDAFQKQGRGR